MCELEKALIDKVKKSIRPLVNELRESDVYSRITRGALEALCEAQKDGISTPPCYDKHILRLLEGKYDRLRNQVASCAGYPFTGNLELASFYAKPLPGVGFNALTPLIPIMLELLEAYRAAISAQVQHVDKQRRPFRTINSN